MALPETLLPLRRFDEAAVTSRLPAPRADLTLRVLDSVRVLRLRHARAPQAIDAACRQAGLAGLPEPGRISGDDPLLLWRSASEWLYVGTGAAPDPRADALIEALSPGRDASALAVDVSDASIALELRGESVDALLVRLFDASAVPAEPGQGWRARLADIAVVVLRRTSRCVWLIADRAEMDYLADWLAYAAQAVPASRSER